MALPQHPPTMTPQEYLAFERTSDKRHEYIDGRIYTMAGASENHNLIVVNLTAGFHRQFRKRPCKVYAESMRVQAGKNYVYPDIVALCGDTDFVENQFDTLKNPQVVIEVTSPSTQRYDKEAKMALYRQMPSIQEVLLVTQTVPHIAHYIRQDNEIWNVRDIFGLDATLKITALDVELALADIYEKVGFPAEEE